MRRDVVRLRLLAMRAISAARFNDAFTAGYDRLLELVGDGAEEVTKDAMREVNNHTDKLSGPLIARLEKALAARNREALVAWAYLTDRGFDSFDEASSWVKAQGAAITRYVTFR